MNNVRFIRNILYQFKKDYGTDIRYIMIDHSEFQADTGERKFIKKVYQLPAVLLPTNMLRKFVQDIGYLAANKNFTYGALNDYLTTSFIVLGEDLPSGIKPDLDGYVIINEERYEKVSIITLDHGVAHLFIAKNAQGGLAYDIQNEVARNSLQISQTVKYELN